mmetsp:Transcript_236/g.591  ORF Transcript_236/g.591 Transcript_236/m.591 type:complete len:295 (-) Transcript_236:51-935(-)
MTSAEDAASKKSSDESEPTEAESKMTEVIAKDRPTIDAAVKSFISMVCASSMTASSTDAAHDRVMMGIIPALAKNSISGDKDDANPTPSTSAQMKKENLKNSTSIQQQVLELGRYILKAVNSYTFPIHDTVAYSLAEKPGTSAEKKKELLEISVVARLWNALIQSDQKPSRFLGRRALKLAWKNLDIEASLRTKEKEEGESTDNDNGAATTTTDTKNQQQHPQHKRVDVRDRQLEWLRRFEKLLFQSPKPLPADVNVDDDSALLWALDNGAAELAKRSHRRIDAAKERGPITPS